METLTQAPVKPKRKKKKHFRLWILLVALFVCGVSIFPFYVLVNLSLRDITDFASRLTLPKKFVFTGYITAMKDKALIRGFINSIILAVTTIVTEITVSAMAGYSLSRGSKKTTRIVKAIQMTIIMVPGIVTLVGTYSLMVKLNLSNNLVALALLIAAGGIPSCAFIYANFMNSIPITLDEAARIDGCGVLKSFFLIILPQLKPITITRAIMIGIGVWNNYLLPLYLINNSNYKPIILVIRSAFSMTGGDRNLALACSTCTLGILPVIVVYCIMQRKIMEAQIGSGIKG